METLSDADARIGFETYSVKDQNNENIFLSANAGSGKSTSIGKFIQNHQDHSILVLSFTKGTVRDLKQKITKEMGISHPNVEYRTFDSICYHNRRTLHNPSSSSYHTSKYFYIKHIKTCFSSHVHMERLQRSPCLIANFTEYVAQAKVPHNVYIDQIVALHKYAWTSFDIVIVDEAQDLDFVRQTFFRKELPGTKLKVFVGDPKQTIYNETSIFDNLTDKDIVFTYTHTFRYGSELIDEINKYAPEHCSSQETKTTVLHTPLDSFQHDHVYILIDSWKQVIRYDLEDYQIVPSGRQKVLEAIKKHKEFKRINSECNRMFFQSRSNVRDDFQYDYFQRMDKLELLDYMSPKWLKLEDCILKGSKKRKHKKGTINTIHGYKGNESDYVFLDESCFPMKNSHPISWKRKDRMFYVAVTRTKKAVSFGSEHYHPMYLTSLIDQFEKKPSLDTFEVIWSKRQKYKRFVDSYVQECTGSFDETLRNHIDNKIELIGN